MKLISIFTFCLFLSFHPLSAQGTLIVKEERRSMSKGERNGFSVEIPQYKLNEIQKEWIKYIRKKTKAKVTNSKTEWSLLATKLDGIPIDTLNTYATFSQTTNGMLVCAFFADKDSFITTTSKPQIAASIQSMMFDFAKSAYLHIVEKELDGENRKLNMLKDEKERLMKSEDKNLHEIEASNHTIESSESELDAVKEELEIKQKDIFAQKQKSLTLSKKSIERQEQNEIVRGMEKDRNKHLKRQQYLANEIAQQNANVRAKERYVMSLKSQQEKKTKEIQKQEELVGTIENKIDSIKKMGQNTNDLK